jgi:hypothetical protein
MLLYGREVHTDYRRITTFGRDISLISEQEYRSFKAPASLRRFPADLATRHLEYSGIYEDGWVSERAFFKLAPHATARHLVVRGFVPKAGSDGFRSRLELAVDGTPVARRELGVGPFEIKVPAGATRGRHRIDLSFDRVQRLAGDDGRAAAAKIEFIGYSDE